MFCPSTQYLHLLSHVMCVGSSKSELPVLVWDERSWCSGTSSLSCYAGFSLGPLNKQSCRFSLEDTQVQVCGFGRVPLPGGWSVLMPLCWKAMDCASACWESCFLASSVE